MKKLFLLFVSIFLLSSCDKEDLVLEPLIEMSLNGESFDPYERYNQIITYGGTRQVGDTIKKIFIL